MKVEKDHKVKVHYKGTLDDGTVFDSSDGRDPLEFIAGSGQVIKGFDEAIIGMDKGEKKTISIKPEDAYGPKVDGLTQEIPIDMFGDHKPEVGTTVGLKAPTGQVMPAKILNVTKDKVKVDLNHPLAGKKLNFELEVVDSNKLSKKEIEDLEKAQNCAPGACGDEGCSHC